MAQYPQLAGLVRTIDPRSPDDGFTRKVVPYLVNVWLDDYSRNGHTTEIRAVPSRLSLPPCTVPALASAASAAPTSVPLVIQSRVLEASLRVAEEIAGCIFDQGLARVP